tara:strand:+ start:90 stop:692 length:603 start_codon:yes stop_codon:yes gene_type:complete
MKNNNLISLNRDPIDLFAEWYEEAKKTEINEPNAMNLATITDNVKISSRIVLLKFFSKKGFVFFTNTLSKKGKCIEANKSVALNFYWKSLQKQIRIEGEASIIKDKQADEYFNSRSDDSKFGAWASSQSNYLNDRLELLKKFNEVKNFFLNKPINRPPYWTGYIVNPRLIEFWQQMPHRLHDRVEYIKIKSSWKARNLYP